MINIVVLLACGGGPRPQDQDNNEELRQIPPPQGAPKKTRMRKVMKTNENRIRKIKKCCIRNIKEA